MLRQQVEELQEDLDGRDMHQVGHAESARSRLVQWCSTQGAPHPCVHPRAAAYGDPSRAQQAPIHYACKRGHAHIVDYLLEQRALSPSPTRPGGNLSTAQWRSHSPRSSGTFIWIQLPSRLATHRRRLRPRTRRGRRRSWSQLKWATWRFWRCSSGTGQTRTRRATTACGHSIVQPWPGTRRSRGGC